MQEQAKLDWVYSLLQRACSAAKELRAITLEEFAQASTALPLLPSLNDKGLLIIVLVRVITQKYLAFPRTIQLLQNQMFPPEKTTRSRRHRADDEEVQPRRRRRVRHSDKDIDLHELSNESLTNPVNMQPMVEGEIRTQLGRDGGNQLIQEPMDMAPEPIDTTFLDAINERERKLQAEREASREQSENSQSHSNSNSSSQNSRFGAITNLDKKLEILGLTGGLNDRTILVDRTVRRPRLPASSNRPTRRKQEVLDQKTMLDETGPTIAHNESMEATMEAVRARRRLPDDYAIRERFVANLDDFAERIRNSIFSQKNQERLIQLSKKARPEQRTKLEIELPQEVTEFSDPLPYMMPDSTLFEPDSGFRQHIDTNIFQGAETITLSELQRNTQQHKAKIFLKLMWLDQQSEVKLEQHDPEHFSEIIVIKNPHREIQI